MRIFIVLFFFFLVGCTTRKISEEEARKKLEDILEVPMPRIQNISNYMSDYSFNGDYIESFIVHLNEDDFVTLTKKIKAIDSLPNSSFSHLKKEEGRYVISVIFDRDHNSLKYTYVYE